MTNKARIHKFHMKVKCFPLGKNFKIFFDLWYRCEEKNAKFKLSLSKIIFALTERTVTLRCEAKLSEAF